MPEEKVTGLHLSMRALLGIIAGLLVADALRYTVSFVTASPRDPQTWANFLVALGATIFVTRVVADNILYYGDADIDTIYGDYWTRVLLILLDLASYSFCYAIVARFTAVQYISRGAVRWMITYATAVEVLHSVWCAVALFCLHIKHAADKETREPWLRKWLKVSALWSGVGIVLTGFAWWCHAQLGAEPTSLLLGGVFFAVSAFAAYTYLRAMKNDYERRRAA